MSEFGICMEGNEPAFRRALDKALVAAPSEPFTYAEIGLATGLTLRGARAYVQSRTAQEQQYFGFDIPAGWSYNPAHLAENFAGTDLRVLEGPLTTPVPSSLGAVTAIIQSAQDVLPTLWRWAIHFAFIDGCHGAACAVRDFRATAPFVPSGGVIVFHDTSPSCQGIHMQPHCGTGIAVRAGLQALGLLTGGCPGWSLVEETNTAHGITVVTRL